MMHRKHWIIAALAAALWISPAAAQSGSTTDYDDDPSGRWPFSGRSRYDQLPPASGTNSTDKNADYGGGRGETEVSVVRTATGAGQGGSKTDDAASTSATTTEGTGSTSGDGEEH